MSDPVYVIAGSFEQFRAWCAERGLTHEHAVFCQFPELLKDCDLYLVGTYAERPAWRQMQRAVEYRQKHHGVRVHYPEL